MTEPQNAEVRHDAERHRYELLFEGVRVGQLAYRERDGVLMLVHTDVAKELEGQGLATRLVAGALADVRERGLRVVPRCEFVLAYLEKHPGDRDLVAQAA